MHAAVNTSPAHSYAEELRGEQEHADVESDGSRSAAAAASPPGSPIGGAASGSSSPSLVSEDESDSDAMGIGMRAFFTHMCMYAE